MSRAVPLSSLPASVRAKLPSHKAKQTAATRQLNRAKAKAQRDTFLAMLRRAKLPTPEAEHHFHPDRMWRFDYAWPDLKVALEVEGGVWTKGRHTRGKGFIEDMQKYNAAGVLGWRVFRVHPQNLSTLSTEQMLRKVLR